MRGDNQLESREGLTEPAQSDPLPPRMEMEVEFIDKHHAFNARGRFGPVDLVEHDGAPGNIGDEGDEYVVAVRELRPGRDVTVFKTHYRALLDGVVPGIGDAGRRADRGLHDRLVEESLRFSLTVPRDIAEHLVLQPLKQRAVIKARVEGRRVGLPAVACALARPLSAATSAHAIDAIPHKQ